MLQVLVNRKSIVAEGICSFELCLANGSQLPAFTAGAHVDVHLPSGVVRQYSLCNAPQERHRYLIGVLKDPSSRGGSQAMHELVEEGQTLHISEPRNLFPLAGPGATHLLIAGGIGITPMLAMAHELQRQGEDFELHYCFRSPDRAAFLDELAHAAFTDRVVLHDDSSAVPSNLDARALLRTPEADRHVYVCGPGGFMDYILGCAAAADWPQAQVHREFFAAPPVDHAADRAFEVQLARSGKVFQIPADRSVFEVLDEAGIQIETSCEQGICGSCITRVVQGIPDHRDQFMTDAEHASNDQFTPCCSRAKTPCLVLDL
ncbi:PDR/VanB family oxidoreductase [Pseudomonas sp. CFBP 13719]|uniref:PDR/VanB family oxidoreductase n=1 Tax=Pseudomonas sp. CFBP 13719 TaxID=2775303 RepID=UPI00177CA5A8|nr:PDR/VanB family oxidoreductase [Pseudomonas sp. CFBP 13719]MBD8682528.1 oxidoreductase [Pseudomonas sp. CFBP 13719]